MKFTLLLLALGQTFKIASRFNKPFKRFIRKSRVRILVTTRDGKRSRLFVFDRGRVSSGPGPGPAPGNSPGGAWDAALVFRDERAGFGVLTCREKDASFNAAACGDLHVEGASVYAQWFQDAAGLVF